MRKVLQTMVLTVYQPIMILVLIPLGMMGKLKTMSGWNMIVTPRLIIKTSWEAYVEILKWIWTKEV